MAYPQTKFTIVDNSDIQRITVPSEEIDRPVYMCTFAAPKGYEEWKTQLAGQKFFDIYGENPSFGTYGQPLAQAAGIITAGGRLTCKRIVAPDSTLANLLIYAEVYKATVQKYDNNGNPIYIDSAGAETIDPTQADPSKGVNGSATVEKAHVIYKATPYGNSGSSSLGNNIYAYREAVRTDVDYPCDAEDGNAGIIDIGGNITTTAATAHSVYPLFLICDNGRGISTKTFRIYADTSSRRPVDYVRYILTIADNGVEKETMAFTLNPDRVEVNRNVSLENVTKVKSVQVRSLIFEDEIKRFASNVSYLAGSTYSDFINQDVLFGLDTYGRRIKTLDIDGTSVAFDNAAGLALLGGTNGSFGNSPMSGTALNLYNQASIAAWSGNDSDEIYDLDNFRVDVIFDANYDDAIKRKIEEFVEFREDVFYFRDMHTGLTTLDAIREADKKNLASRLCATYQNSWDIIEPYSRKQVTVTATYNLAMLFVQHYIDGQTRPFCGQLYKITFPEVVEGTVNFAPKNTPSEDQKQTIDDMRINYASYYSGLLTMETEYTSQERYTQLSWINNVLTLHGLIRDIRKKCPKIRYNFLDSDSLEKYMDDVQSVIDRHTHNFQSIEMKYIADNVYEQNKIFYAEIEVKMRNFIQSEFFKITVVKG